MKIFETKDKFEPLHIQSLHLGASIISLVQICQGSYNPLPPTDLITAPLTPSHFRHGPNALTYGTHEQNGYRVPSCPHQLRSCCIQPTLFQTQHLPQPDMQGRLSYGNVDHYL